MLMESQSNCLKDMNTHYANQLQWPQTEMNKAAWNNFPIDIGVEDYCNKISD